jgi:murein DD-endopeptidase MepM/ murein hydrolase activator NlpD
MTSGLLISLLLAQGAPSLGQGRAHATALRAGEVAKTWAQSSGAPGLRFSSLAELQRFSATLRGYGTETKVVSEGLDERDGAFVYRRVSAVSNWARGMTLELQLDAQGRLLGGTMDFATREAPTAYGAYRPLVKLQLPLEETWHVLWGGRTWDDNRHASVSDMRFALDLLQRKNGSSAQPPGERNEDYYAWGQWVLAPADGVIAVAEDGVVDNAPNRAQAGNLYGNVIVVDHGAGEFTLLGHLQRGSVLVRPGDHVTAGQRLARVGNSGMSTEPHLHFQLMDTADWRTAHGLPMVLTGAARNGTPLDRFEPRRGDVLTRVDVEARR